MSNAFKLVLQFNKEKFIYQSIKTDLLSCVKREDSEKKWN